MSFAWNLKTLRSEKDMTQGELAGKIGVSQKTLSSWETGRTEPNIGEVIALCDALGCTLEKLTGVKTRNIGDISFEDIVVKIRTMSLKELSELHSVVAEAARDKERLERIEQERKMYLDRIAEYEAEISMLKKKVLSSYD